MTHPTISALAFIGLVFALAVAARLLLRAVLVIGLMIADLANGPASATPDQIDLPFAA